MEQLRYPFELPPLPYPYEALEPVISAETLHFHHDKHLQTYIDNLNTALSDCPECQRKSLEELLRQPNGIPEPKRTAVRRNGGGVYNHILYFNAMAPGGGTRPTGPLAAAVCDAFGSYDGWRQKMKAAAVGQFGSGYAWLASDQSGALSVVQTANQDTPLAQGLRPLLCVDVWEHAYYLDYQNRRADYVERWFDLIRWSYVEELYCAKG